MSDIHSIDSGLFNIEDLQEYTPPKSYRIISDGILEVGTRLLLFGDEGTWKSGMAMHLANCVATGRRWLGFYTWPANVLFIQGEMSLTQTKIRNEKYCAGSEKILLSKNHSLPSNPSPAELDRALAEVRQQAYPTNIITRRIDFLHLDEPSGFAMLKRDIQTLIPRLANLPLLVIIDPLYKIFRHELTKEDDAKYFGDNIDLLFGDKDLWNYIPGMAVALVHHARKPGTDKDGNVVRAGSDEMFGSAYFKWWPDTIMSSTLDENDETKQTVNMKFTKAPRIGDSVLPSRIAVRWNKDLYHPRVIARVKAEIPDDETDTRSSLDLNLYE